MNLSLCKPVLSGHNNGAIAVQSDVDSVGRLLDRQAQPELPVLDGILGSRGSHASRFRLFGAVVLPNRFALQKHERVKDSGPHSL